MRTVIILVFFVQIFKLNNIAQNIENSWIYPTINPDTAIDTYFGKKIIDPFRNLENIDDNQVKVWINSQNEFYDTIIQNIYGRERLEKEIESMNKKQEQWAWVARPAANRVVVDYGYMNDDIERLGIIDNFNQGIIEVFNTSQFNKENNTIYTIDYYEPSFDGKYVAFGMSANGSERSMMYIVDIVQKKLLPEHIEFARGGNPQWLPDGSGFFYKQNKSIQTSNDIEGSMVKLHMLNTDPKNDKEIFSRKINKNIALEKIDIPMLFTFPSSDYVLINIQKGTDAYYSIYYAKLKDVLNTESENISWKKVCDSGEKLSSNALNGNQLFALSYKNNPNGQILKYILPNLESNLLFDGDSLVIDDMIINQNAVYISCQLNGIAKLAKLRINELTPTLINLPFAGGINLRPNFPVVSFFQHSPSAWFEFSAYNKQSDMYVCDSLGKVIKSNISKEVNFSDKSEDIVVEEKQVKALDGEMIPLSIVYKKGIKLDGNNPTIINAYGAYGYSIKPTFDKNRLAWFNRGGIFAVAHVRGGGEKGDNWYNGGFKSNKANSWKDLIECAEYMIRNKYTSSAKLALMGMSAGGITIGRAITERPDLFKAAIIYVGSLNILRIENSINTMSVSEFGTIKDSIEVQYLYNMDVYHHIRENVKYPSILFTASLNDSRVSPSQVTKTTALMQQISKGENIVLLRVDDGGHFSYPSDADVYSFLLWQLGHPDFKLKEKKEFHKNIKK